MMQRCSPRARPKAGDSAAVSAFALIQPGAGAPFRWRQKGRKPTAEGYGPSTRQQP